MKTLTPSQNSYRIKDEHLAPEGAALVDMARAEMPGLRALLKRYGEKKPLKGTRISGCLHMTIQTAVLIETLQGLGADLRWSSCNVFSTQDEAAAYVVQYLNIPVFAWKGETVEEYWHCVYRSLFWENGEGPHLLIDDGGDATLMIHEGVALEKGSKWIEQASESEEETALKKLLKKIQKEEPLKWKKLMTAFQGLSEETTTGVRRLYEREKKGTLLVPAVNVNDSVTKSKFDNLYGCRESLIDGIRRATDVMLGGKTAVVCGYGDVGKGCAQALKNAGATVYITEIDPICALQASMEGYRVAQLETLLDQANIYVTATGNRDIITLEAMKQMKDQAIVCNIGHFDAEIQVKALNEAPDIEMEVIKTEQEGAVDKYLFPQGHCIYLLAKGRLVNLACATGHPSFVMSHSFTNQILAQIELWEKLRKNKTAVYLLPRHLDEEVARLHLPQIGATLTTLTPTQSRYINLPPQGPYKPPHYRY